jgi:hypothetical protein
MPWRRGWLLVVPLLLIDVWESPPSLALVDMLPDVD